MSDEKAGRKFDRDPEALAWARAKVQAVVDKYTDFEAQAKGDTVAAARWRTATFVLRRELIGGEGCTITRFDYRSPTVLAALDDGPVPQR